MWAIAHDSGFKLPVKSYWDFCELVYADPSKVSSLGDYLDIMHRWTEKIQSSPAAIERSIYEVIGKEYRSSRVSTIELRFNPMKRNLGGERDLDYIIAAALRGMDRACLDYGVKAGLIFCLAREFDYDAQRDHRASKAEKWRDHGVIGIDLAGPEQHTLELGGDVDRYRDLFARARAAGLGTTVHTGETTHTGAGGRARGDREAQAGAHRPRHRRRAVGGGDAQARRAAASCSSSARRRTCARTRSPTWPICKRVFDSCAPRGVRLTINTDGTYLLGTTLRKEFDLLLGEEHRVGGGGAHVHRQRARRQLHPALADRARRAARARAAGSFGWRRCSLVLERRCHR